MRRKRAPPPTALAYEAETFGEVLANEALLLQEAQFKEASPLCRAALRRAAAAAHTSRRST